MDRTPVADGFDDNDLRLLALRAKTVKDALSELNRPPPFNEARLRAFLDLLEASEEPKDIQLVLEAIVSAHQSVRLAYGQNIGADKAPQAAKVHTELAALRTELGDIVAGFIDRLPPVEMPGPHVDAAPIEEQIEPLRERQREIYRVAKDVQKELVGTPLRQSVTGGLLSQLIDPTQALAFLALFILARLSQGRLGQQALESLLTRQEDHISAFEQAVERNRQAVNTVAGLYNRTKAVAATARSKVASVRRGITRIFGVDEQTSGTQIPEVQPPVPEASPEAERDPPPFSLHPEGDPGHGSAISGLDSDEAPEAAPKNPAFPEPRIEVRGIRDLPPGEPPIPSTPPAAEDPPTPDLPPPDCTTEDGRPGYLLAGTCYPLDTTELRLDGKEDIDFAKLAAFRQLRVLDLDNTQVSDLTPVAGLSGLRSLYLNNTQVSDLTPVKRLEKLRRLVLPDGKELGGFRDDDKNRRKVQDFLATL